MIGPIRSMLFVPGTRHDRFAKAMNAGARQAPQVFAIQPEQIERHEVRPLATKHQVVEVAATIRLETNDLAIEDGRITSNGVRELGAEIRPRLVFAPAPRNQLALLAVDVGERAEAVPFHFHSQSG